MVWLDDLKTQFEETELPEIEEEIEIPRHPESYEFYDLTEEDILKIKYTVLQFAAILIEYKKYNDQTTVNTEVTQISSVLRKMPNFSMEDEAVDKFAGMLHDVGLRATHQIDTEEQS